MPLDVPKNFDWKRKWKTIEFEDTIRIADIVRNNHQVYFIAESLTVGGYYKINLSDFLDMIPQLKDGQTISGTFKIAKRGTSFGIRLKDVERQPEVLVTVSKMLMPFYDVWWGWSNG